MNIYKAIICRDIAAVGAFDYVFYYLFLLVIAVLAAFGTLNMFIILSV